MFIIPMFPYGEDNGAVADAEHLLKSYDIDYLLDEIASADPPAYLHRLFAEDVATRQLSPARILQLAACAMVIDAVADAHDYKALEQELIADWREHYLIQFAALKPLAAKALQGAIERPAAPEDAEALDELRQLEHRLSGS
jgi:hypothetical protein